VENLADKLICTCCGSPRKLDDFYASSSPFHKAINKMHVCKQCIWDYAEQNKESLDHIKSILRMLDRPFLRELWASSIQEIEKSNKDLFKTYFKNLAMPQYRELTWDDSEFGEKNDNNVLLNDDEEIDENVMRHWGKGYSNWEYLFLEDERYKIMTSFECPDYGMEMIMKDICFINLDIEKLRQEKKENSGKTITNLIKTRSDLMNDANMKPIQSTGAEGNDQIAFGTLIKKWENERPVPKPLEDEMKEYIDTYMVGHLAKMEGLNNELTEKYDNALSKYTINFNEINRHDEELED
jgi:hypothetical protein